MGSTCGGKHRPPDLGRDQCYMFMDDVVTPPVPQRDPASLTDPKAWSVGTGKAGGERDATAPGLQANVSMGLFPIHLRRASQCCLDKVKSVSFRIVRILCSPIKPHRCLARAAQSSAAYRLV